MVDLVRLSIRGHLAHPLAHEVVTTPGVPDFTCTCPTSTTSASVPYIVFEAPLHHEYTNVAALSAAEKSAYN